MRLGEDEELDEVVVSGRRRGSSGRRGLDGGYNDLATNADRYHGNGPEETELDEVIVRGTRPRPPAEPPQGEKPSVLCHKTSRGAVSGFAAGYTYSAVMSRQGLSWVNAAAGVVGASVGAFDSLAVGDQAQVITILGVSGASGAFAAELLMSRGRSVRSSSVVAGGVAEPALAGASSMNTASRLLAGGIIGAGAESILGGKGPSGFAAGAASQAASMAAEAGMDYLCQ